MMEPEVMAAYDVDLEEGELSAVSSEEVYVPLERPASSSNTNSKLDSPLATCHQMQSALTDAVVTNDGSSASTSSTSSTDEESDNCLKKATATEADAVAAKRKQRKHRVKRTVMVRLPPTDDQERRARFKKYNIWTAALQEEALTENMRGCDVTHDAYNDRNVENYDFSIKYRLNGENSLKRRLSNSTDEEVQHPMSKRRRDSSSNDAKRIKAGVKDRFKGRRKGRGGSYGSRRHDSPASYTSGSDNSNEPRYIEDLDAIEGREPSAVAQEMARKLYEEKDELLVRIVKVLGLNIPLEIYKETQRIEADGGMMVMQGNRRRTPGGVFLFLLKKHDNITPEQCTAIFAQDRQNVHKLRRDQESFLRNKKVEELKKRLSAKDNELALLRSRKELVLLGAELNSEYQSGNLSNPPPSPVLHEQSPDYKTHAINHDLSDTAAMEQQPTTSSNAAINDIKTSKVADGSNKDLVAYDDDFLDVQCGDMDFF